MIKGDFFCDRMPVISVTQTGTIEQIEACGAFWPEANYDAEKMRILSEASHTVVGFEAVRVPFDITTEAEFFGSEIKDGTKEQQPEMLYDQIAYWKAIIVVNSYRLFPLKHVPPAKAWINCNWSHNLQLRLSNVNTHYEINTNFPHSPFSYILLVNSFNQVAYKTTICIIVSCTDIDLSVSGNSLIL